MTPREYFDSLVATIKERSDDFEGVNWVLGYDFSGDDNGIWSIAIQDGKPQPVVEGAIPAGSDFTSKIKFADFLKIQSEELDAEEALKQGIMSFEGDPRVMLRLMYLLA